MNETSFLNIFSKRLKMYLSREEMSQKELAEKLHVSATAVSNWCNGTKAPRMDKVDMMCKIFSCRRSDLIEDKPVESSKPKRTGVTINVLGRVAAGIPIEAIEDAIDTEEIPEEMAKDGEYFGLQIHGDSMMPRMREGDVVIVRKQDDAETDQIVIALINGNDAVCKRLLKYKDGISLVSNNPAYDPLVFTAEQIKDLPVRIIGKVVECRQKYD